MQDASQSAIFRNFPHPPPQDDQGPGSPQPISPVLTMTPSSSSSGPRTVCPDVPAAAAPTPTARLHQCRACSARFASARMRAMHERVAHERAALWRCAHCAALHGSARQLSDHILAAHRGATHAMRCTRCTATFASAALLRHHLAAHNAADAAVSKARRRHPCAHCAYVADALGALRFHVADRHPVEAGLLPRTLSTTAPPRAAALRRSRERRRPADALFRPDKENHERYAVVPNGKVRPLSGAAVHAAPAPVSGAVLQSHNAL